MRELEGDFSSLMLLIASSCCWAELYEKFNFLFLIVVDGTAAGPAASDVEKRQELMQKQ